VKRRIRPSRLPAARLTGTLPTQVKEIRMHSFGWTALAGIVIASAGAYAQDPLPPLGSAPLLLADDLESVYAPPEIPSEADGVNEGGVNIALQVAYMTDYVYRGVDRSEVGGYEDAPNLQVDGKLSWNLGELPHPFIGIFANVYDSDPISRFQEIRPYLGADWNIRPFIFSFGHINYIYPDRDDFNTSEVFVKVVFDDSFLFSTERPIFSPYVFGAYDYDLNNGYYLEAGISHDIPIEDTGIVLTFTGNIAYVNGIQHQFAFFSRDDEGLQHWEVGMIGTYSLNTLLNFSRRYGEWTLKGYLFYTDGIEEGMLAADNQLWGGVAIGFRY
jgi:hypothetical protein